MGLDVFLGIVLWCCLGFDEKGEFVVWNGTSE